MKSLLVSVLLGLFCAVASCSGQPEPIPEAPKEAPKEVIEGLLAASVMVKANGGTGSGVCYHNKAHAFVWTDAHVCVGNKKIDFVIDLKSGQKVPKVWFHDLELIQDEFKDGRKVGFATVFAKIIRYSERHDIAVLKPYKKWPDASVRFAADIPRPGTALWHVGSMRGVRGMNSVSVGVFSTAGRLRRDFQHEEFADPLVYDHVTLTAHPGSSGGGVFLGDGSCIGLVTEFLGGGHTFGSLLISPTRRLREFATEAKCLWALDDTVAVPEKDDEPAFSDGTIPALPEVVPVP